LIYKGYNGLSQEIFHQMNYVNFSNKWDFCVVNLNSKTIINFGWSHLLSEMQFAWQMAYTNISRIKWNIYFVCLQSLNINETISKMWFI